MQSLGQVIANYDILTCVFEVLIREPGFDDIVCFTGASKLHRHYAKKWELSCLTTCFITNLHWSQSVAEAAARRVSAIRPLMGLPFMRALMALANVYGVWVAGSAVLYLECIKVGRNCDWFPGNIDCFVDYRNFGDGGQSLPNGPLIPDGPIISKMTRGAASTVNEVASAVIISSGGLYTCSVCDHLLVGGMVDGERVATDGCPLVPPKTQACRALCQEVVATLERLPVLGPDFNYYDVVTYTQKPPMNKVRYGEAYDDPRAAENVVVDLIHSQVGKISVILAVPKPCVCGDCKLCHSSTFGDMDPGAPFVPPHHQFDLDIVSVALVTTFGNGLVINWAHGHFSSGELDFDTARFTVSLQNELVVLASVMIVTNNLSAMDPSAILVMKQRLSFPRSLKIPYRVNKYLQRGWKHIVAGVPSGYVGYPSSEWVNITMG